MKKLIIFLIIFLLFGCEKAKVTKIVDIGQVINVQVIEKNFNGSSKMLISTDKATVITVGTYTILKGQQASIAIFKDKQYLCIEDKCYCYKIY